MVYLPRPEHVKKYLTKPLIDIANYSIRVEVFPPGDKLSLDREDGIKVIFGSVKEIINETQVLRVRRPLGGAPFPAKATLRHHGNSVLKADDRLGAIILHLVQRRAPGRWSKASAVPVTTTFDLSDQGIRFPDLAFVKVQDLWWGGNFKGYDFYNLTGFHFRLQDNKQNLCHMQFWTAGPNVHAEYHNHSDNAFKELHTCLSQGTPNNGDKKIGGMWSSRPSTCDSIIPVAALSLDENAFPKPPKNPLYCGLKPLEEHGRIWHEDATRNAVYRKNNTVSYPRHEWAAGDGGNMGAIDVWMALEFDAWLDFDI
ncbi:hypothetical protein BDW74DRAFT_189202 [Aspergillus multicolor]|uniref:uncharacterized protein n=1 Tax=Aspergillus multicolor TaxID=41759 RepID=UPI003CCD98E4